ncbi:MAG TPA: DUF4870 domain-containing protein [Pseudogracilibacillus sp.]|nr:DUF4870 domain-containing protein [Pseudogracilibacillus sp.]
MQTTNDERMFAMLIYLTSLVTTIIGPILIWLLKREESEFIDYHGKEYLNFIISFAVYGFAASALMVIAVGFLLAPIVGVVAFIFTIIAAVKSYNGELYRIPLIFRLIK